MIICENVNIDGKLTMSTSSAFITSAGDTYLNSVSANSITDFTFVGSKVLTSNGKNIDESNITTTELNYLSGVSANIQSQINLFQQSNHSHTNKALLDKINQDLSTSGNTIFNSISAIDFVDSNFSGNYVLVSDSTKKLTESSITTASLNYLSGTSANINTQLQFLSATKANTAIIITATSGLTGGGNLASNRTIGMLAVGTSGSYYKVTTNAYGQVTSGQTSLTSGDIPQLGATKIGSGNISNTEFEYLDGVSANIQNQLNNVVRQYNYPTYNLGSNENTGNYWTMMCSGTLPNIYGWQNGELEIVGGYQGRVQASVSWVITDFQDISISAMAIPPTLLVFSKNNSILPSNFALVVTSDYPSAKKYELWFNSPSSFTALTYSFKNVNPRLGTITPTSSPAWTSASSSGFVTSGVCNLIVNSLQVGNVSNTEINYLDGTSANIQTQLNSKSDSSHFHTYILGYGASPASSAVPSSFAPTAGLSFHTVYNTGYPGVYGNILNIRGTGGNQLFAEWAGSDAGAGGLWFRNKRDNYNGWSAWQQVIDTVSHAPSISNWNTIASRGIPSNIGTDTYQGNDSDTWQTRMNARGTHFGRINGVSNSPTYFNYLMLRETKSTIYGAIGFDVAGNWYTCTSYYNSEVSQYNKLWTSADFTSTSISNWNTAYTNTHTHNQSLNTSADVTFSRIRANVDGTGMNVMIGNDVWLGDVNIASTMSLMGTNSSTSASGYIRFGADSNKFGYNGSNLIYGGTFTGLTRMEVAGLNLGYYSDSSYSGIWPTGVPKNDNNWAFLSQSSNAYTFLNANSEIYLQIFNGSTRNTRFRVTNTANTSLVDLSVSGTITTPWGTIRQYPNDSSYGALYGDGVTASPSNYTFAWKRDNSHLVINSNLLSLASSGATKLSINSNVTSLTDFNVSGTNTIYNMLRFQTTATDGNIVLPSSYHNVSLRTATASLYTTYSSYPQTVDSLICSNSSTITTIRSNVGLGISFNGYSSIVKVGEILLNGPGSPSSPRDISFSNGDFTINGCDKLYVNNILTSGTYDRISNTSGTLPDGFSHYYVSASTSISRLELPAVVNNKHIYIAFARSGPISFRIFPQGSDSIYVSTGSSVTYASSSASTILTYYGLYSFFGKDGMWFMTSTI